MQPGTKTAEKLLAFIRGDWIGIGHHASKPALVRLLLGIYVAEKPVSRKKAMMILGVEHYATSAKHVLFALEHGWLKTIPSKDKREDLVAPSARLVAVIEKNIANLTAAP